MVVATRKIFEPRNKAELYHQFNRRTTEPPACPFAVAPRPNQPQPRVVDVHGASKPRNQGRRKLPWGAGAASGPRDGTSRDRVSQYRMGTNMEALDRPGRPRRYRKISNNRPNRSRFAPITDLSHPTFFLQFFVKFQFDKSRPAWRLAVFRSKIM